MCPRRVLGVSPALRPPRTHLCSYSPGLGCSGYSQTLSLHTLPRGIKAKMQERSFQKHGVPMARHSWPWRARPGPGRLLCE